MLGAGMDAVLWCGNAKYLAVRRVDLLVGFVVAQSATEDGGGLQLAIQNRMLGW